MGWLPRPMRWLGYLVTFGGIVAIVLPIVAVVSGLVGGPDLGVALRHAPTFVIGGIILFVLGVGIRIYADR